MKRCLARCAEEKTPSLHSVSTLRLQAYPLERARAPARAHCLPSTSPTLHPTPHSIFAYIVVYAILYKVGYLSKLAPSGGSVQFDLAAPNQNASSTSVDVTTLEYCSQDPHSATRTAKAYPCVWFDGLQTRIIQGDSILVTTRVTGTIQKRTACGETCTELWTPPLATKLTQSNTFFVADPESYEFKILHSVQQTAIGTEECRGRGGGGPTCMHAQPFHPPPIDSLH